MYLIVSQRNTLSFFLVLFYVAVFVSFASILILIGVNSFIKGDFSVKIFLAPILSVLLIYFGFRILYYHFKNAPNIKINQNMIVINKESFDLNDIKEINLSGKWYLKMGIGIKSIEGFSIIFNNNIEKVFFDKMYSNSSDIKLFLEQFVLKQKKINNIVSENNFGEYINQYENEEIFKGNLLFCFDGILFWLVLMIFIYFMFFNGFDSKQLTLYLIFGCFAISWLIFMPRNLNYFSLTNEHLIIRNHIFFWKKKKYNLKNLKELVFEFDYKRKSIRVVMENFNHKTYIASSLKDKKWLEFMKSAKSKRINIRNEWI